MESKLIIKKINIENYKCFYGTFSLELNEHINIIVGDNSSGKSTILEAINLALTGILNGKYLRNELSQYLFNQQIVDEYIDSLSPDKDTQEPPSICIEVFFADSSFPQFNGDDNSDKKDACGLYLKIEYDEDYNDKYEELIDSGELKAIPIEYYKITWQSFARKSISSRIIPIKSVLIDSSSTRYNNGSDVYISRIIQEELDDSERIAISQEYRKLKEAFGENESVKTINTKIKDKSKILDKKLFISIDLDAQNSWQTTLMTYLDNVPFHYIGKGEQCVIKTNLALGHKKSQEANLILLEEPENHLSHTKLNQLLKSVEDELDNKQIIVSTHNSFVANKLGLENLILINNGESVKLKELDDKTFNYFKKLSGYNTLRLLLCNIAVLVEGDSDELIFQKAYRDKNDGRLPIENGIDVISVGLSFERFLDIAKLVHQPVAVITDNDRDYEKNIIQKYKEYETFDFIKICADGNNSLNTLEPQFVEANDKNLDALRDVIILKNRNQYQEKKAIVEFMTNDKTRWSLRVFENDNTKLNYPEYIENAVEWCIERK